MRILITGGCGFIGSNLAAETLLRGDELIVADSLFRSGSEKNLKWLRSKGVFKFYHLDIRNYNDVEYLISKEQPDVIFHLAGQVAMTTSISNPRLDFETNTLGTLNILECIRKFTPDTSIIYSSSNKVYGDFNRLTIIEKELRYECPDYPNGFTEDLPLNFHSPYGCSKGASDQYLLDYARIYGIKSVVLRHSSMYGGNQHPTEDQGWVGWFCKKALETTQNDATRFTISGSGKQVRDVLHASDVVRLYFDILENINVLCGEAYNIGGGIENSLSLLELFEFLEKSLNIKLRYNQLPPRQSDQLIFVADNKKIMSRIAWKPLISSNEGIIKLIQWMKSTQV